MFTKCMKRFGTNDQGHPGRCWPSITNVADSDDRDQLVLNSPRDPDEYSRLLADEHLFQEMVTR